MARLLESACTRESCAGRRHQRLPSSEVSREKLCNRHRLRQERACYGATRKGGSRQENIRGRRPRPRLEERLEAREAPRIETECVPSTCHGCSTDSTRELSDLLLRGSS